MLIKRNSAISFKMNFLRFASSYCAAPRWGQLFPIRQRLHWKQNWIYHHRSCHYFHRSGKVSSKYEQFAGLLHLFPLLPLPLWAGSSWWKIVLLTVWLESALKHFGTGRRIAPGLDKDRLGYRLYLDDVQVCRQWLGRRREKRSRRSLTQKLQSMLIERRRHRRQTFNSAEPGH